METAKLPGALKCRNEMSTAKLVVIQTQENWQFPNVLIFQGTCTCVNSVAVHKCQQ